ncbi:MAG: Crp/Fnr family transcriptional regulator [Sandaracinus sp.]
MNDAPRTSESQREQVLRRVRGMRLLRGADDALVRELGQGATLHRLARGERLWVRGTPAEHFYQVLRGVLELRRATAGHEPTLVAFFGPGECPAVPVALERKRFIADSFATTGELEVLAIPSGPILERLPRDAALAGALNRALLDHARLLHAKIDVLTAGPVPDRIATFLLDLAERFGDEREDGSVAIPLALSRDQVASYVDARVETVIRCFSAWRREGLLVLESEATVLPSIDALGRTLGAERAPSRRRD